MEQSQSHNAKFIQTFIFIAFPATHSIIHFYHILKIQFNTSIARIYYYLVIFLYIYIVFNVCFPTPSIIYRCKIFVPTFRFDSMHSTIIDEWIFSVHIQNYLNLAVNNFILPFLFFVYSNIHGLSF